MLNIGEKKTSWVMFYRMRAGQMAVLQCSYSTPVAKILEKYFERAQC